MNLMLKAQDPYPQSSGHFNSFSNAFLFTHLTKLGRSKGKKCSLDQSRSSALTYIYDVIMYVFRSHLKVTPFNPLCLDDFFIYVIQLHPSLQAHGAGELGNWKGITTTGKATA